MPAKRLLQLPFIDAIARGTCPRCGHAGKFRSEPQQFWKRFSCRCGYSVKAHIEDRN